MRPSAQQYGAVWGGGKISEISTLFAWKKLWREGGGTHAGARSPGPVRVNP